MLDYQGSDCVLHLGDSRSIIPQLSPVSAVVTDPPYGAGLCAGDESPEISSALLADVLKLSMRLLQPGAHVVYFWGSIGLDLAIEAGKSVGLEYKRLLTMYIPQGNARPYLGWLPRVQPIVVMRVPGRDVPEWRNVVAQAIFDAAKAKGLSMSAVASALGCSARLVMKWWRVDDPAWSYPNYIHRLKLEKLLDITIPEPPVLDTTSRHDLYEVRGGGAESSHPCEKPQWVMEDIIGRVVPPGGTVLDPFAGSGTTLLAARKMGRRAVGVEIDESAFRSAVNRLNQKNLF